MSELGYDCPDTFGDPAILLPYYLKPKLDNNSKYPVGIVPHFRDYVEVNARFSDRMAIKVINVAQPVDKVVADLCSCENILASSLHGLIVSHAYGVQAAHVVSEATLGGDNIKFKDYAEGVNVELNSITKKLSGCESTSTLTKLATRQVIPKLTTFSKELLCVCPFKERYAAPSQI